MKSTASKIDYREELEDVPDALIGRIQKLNEIGISLSAEKNTLHLLERILEEAKGITHADGGTLYLLSNDNRHLSFEIMRTDSLHIRMGGTNASPVSLAPIDMFLENGDPNDSLVVAYCANHGHTINIADAYSADGFDFSGTKQFDQEMHYRSLSFLTVPMEDHQNQVIGVLQLINKQSRIDGSVLEFDNGDKQLAESLASQAAVALTNKRLIDELKTLFEAFIELLATAIDNKSPYTGNHCRRVPILTMMLAEKACQIDYGPLKSFHLKDEDQYALKVAAWLHDCGKITTPEYVVDKATKLETIFDRIELIDTRFEVLKRDIEIRKLRQQVHILQTGEMSESIEHGLNQACLGSLHELNKDREFLREANIGKEFMSDEHIQQVEHIAQQQWSDPDGDLMPFLSAEEVYNLSIKRGTLNSEERDVINHHISMTIKMLNSLPFPKHLESVPEYAGGHHERMDGRGYPNGLSGDELSVPARTMAIADIFEALTAKDRPYKEAKTLSESLAILGQMKLDSHIDPDLFDIFINEKIYLDYARQYLADFQIDMTEPAEIPGYPFKRNCVK